MAAFSIANLAAELKNDPKALGYSALVTAGNCSGLANLLNALTGAGTGNTPREPITIPQFLGQLNAGEAASFTATTIAWLTLVCLPLTVNLSDPSTQAILLALFTNATQTKANMTAFVNRTGSRAEFLWGTGTTIQAADVAAAIATGQA